MASVDSLAARLLSATLMFDRASLAALEALAPVPLNGLTSVLMLAIIIMLR